MRILEKLRNKRGFTLVELIFEIAVLALLVIPTVILLGQLFLSIIQTEKNSVATALSVQKAEEEMWKYTSFAAIGNSSGTFLSPFAAYSYNVDVTYADANNPDIQVALSDYKKVAVTVSKGGSQVVELDFLLPNIY